ncbi:hypothetical protein KAX02_13530 [candidate division WOR-3 bacterium]|nr:hypothetical protein [candidate division WOR-3 bacterium]
MEEKEWKAARRTTEGLLRSAERSIKTARRLKVLLGAENECCDTILTYIESILGYWNERSVASKLRFVEETCNE